MPLGSCRQGMCSISARKSAVSGYPRLAKTKIVCRTHASSSSFIQVMRQGFPESNSPWFCTDARSHCLGGAHGTPDKREVGWAYRPRRRPRAAVIISHDLLRKERQTFAGGVFPAGKVDCCLREAAS